MSQDTICEITSCGKLLCVLLPVFLVLTLHFHWYQAFLVSVMITLCLLVGLFNFIIVTDYSITPLHALQAVMVGDDCLLGFEVRSRSKYISLPRRLEVPIRPLHGSAGCHHVKIPWLLGDMFTSRILAQNRSSAAKRFKTVHHLQIELPSQARERLCVGPLRISTTDIFGLFKVSKGFSEEFEVYVYPEHIRLSAKPSPQLSDLGGRVTKTQMSNSLHLKSVREFAPGDQAKFIHQKISAKLSKPYVKQFESVQEDSTLVVFDNVYAHWESDTEFELGVCVLTSLLRTLPQAKFATTAEHPVSTSSTQTNPKSMSLRANLRGDELLKTCSELKRIKTGLLAQQAPHLRANAQKAGEKVILISGSHPPSNSSAMERVPKSTLGSMRVVNVKTDAAYRKRRQNQSMHFQVGQLKDVYSLLKDLNV